MCPHKVLPKIVMILSYQHDAWIVGSCGEWLCNDMKSTPPNDIDILVPIENWNRASSLIPSDGQINTFGGIKFTTCWRDRPHPVRIDLWGQSLNSFLTSCIKPVKAYQLKANLKLEVNYATISR